jgi:hypothetical protein
MSYPHPDNPDGKGFHPDPAQLHGLELPEVEDPLHRISNSADQPRPIGFGALPSTSRMRLESAIDVDGGSEQPLPTVYNVAHPRNRLPLGSITGPVLVRVFGCRPQGAWSFALPYDALGCNIAIGRREWSLPLRLDTIRIWPDTRRVSLCYRATFKYHFKAAARRVARLARAA